MIEDPEAMLKDDHSFSFNKIMANTKCAKTNHKMPIRDSSKMQRQSQS
jgi:hypothetical protein